MSAFAHKPAPIPTYEQLRSVIRHLHESADVLSTEMHRILHDELGGMIVAASMDLAAVARYFESVGPVDYRIKRAQSSIVAAVDLKRRLSEGFRPSLLDNMGLFAALRRHLKEDCAHSSALCTEHYPEQEMSLTAAATTALYRIGQKSLELVFAEPNLKSVDLEIKVDDAALQMTLTHDHSVPEPVDLFSAMPEDMHSLTERSQTLGGELQVGSSEAGTALVHRFPLARILAAA